MVHVQNTSPNTGENACVSSFSRLVVNRSQKLPARSTLRLSHPFSILFLSLRQPASLYLFRSFPFLFSLSLSFFLSPSAFLHTHIIYCVLHASLPRKSSQLLSSVHPFSLLFSLLSLSLSLSLSFSLSRYSFVASSLPSHSRSCAALISRILHCLKGPSVPPTLFRPSLSSLRSFLLERRAYKRADSFLRYPPFATLSPPFLRLPSLFLPSGCYFGIDLPTPPPSSSSRCSFLRCSRKVSFGSPSFGEGS